jgi:signal transduction histidine kinase
VPWRSSLLIAAIQLLGSRGAANSPMNDTARHLDAGGIALLLAGPLLLLLRRRQPWVSCLGTSAATAGYLAADYPVGPIFVSFVVSLVVTVDIGARYAAWSSGVLLFLTLQLISFHRGEWTLLASGGELVWLVLLLIASEVIRARRNQALQERRRRQEERRRREGDERLRIARELHDVLAHSISLIHVQASVALEILDERPEQARTALTTIKQASKEALGEVRQVLGTLRGTDEEESAAPPRAPAPGLDRLGELVEQADSVGLKVTVRTEGRLGPLPAGVDLAAFRIVQEALTNVVRHSGARTALVLLTGRPDGTVVVSVTDDGGGSTGAGSKPIGAGQTGSGNGLIGMRERAVALGGRVEAGPQPGGGFLVRAELPTDSQQRAGDDSMGGDRTPADEEPAP